MNTRRKTIANQKQAVHKSSQYKRYYRRKKLSQSEKKELLNKYIQQAETVLSGFSLDVNDKTWEKLIQDAATRVTRSFSMDRFTLYGMRERKGDVFRSRYYKDRITEDNYEDFTDNVYANSDELIDLILEERGIVLNYLASKLVRFDAELRSLKSGFTGLSEEAFTYALVAKLSETDILERFKTRIEHYFTKKRIEKLLAHNPNYEEIAKAALGKQAQNASIEKHILENIPDNYIDLYPEARQLERHFILHIGPTNSGKTHDALEELRQAPSGVYLAPLRLLACEVKDRLNDAGTPCDLITGEEREYQEESRHMASTIEMLDTSRFYDVAVIDEGQMISDTQRGGSWTAAILGVCANTVHICMAEYARDIVISLIEECSDTYEIVNHYRQTRLSFDNEEFTFPESVRNGDALIVFSKRDVLSCAAVLQRNGINCSVVYGALPYDARKSEVARFLDGETKVIVATDAIGMGMNLPIRRVVFLRTMKFDGIDTRTLYPEEVQQIAGRAGRRGMFETGFYTSEFDKGLIRSLYHENVPQIVRAPIGFPKSLIHIEGKLSDIMNRWSRIQSEDDELFYKGDITEMMTLCKWMEQYTDDKELTYSFSTMPFDIKNETLIGIWEHMVIDTINRQVTEYIPPLYKREDLQSMESAFRVCDLYYCYAERVDSSYKEEICKDRADIAAGIADYLRTHELPVRRCRGCGRELAWNYPHMYCNRCIRSRR